MNLKQNVLLVLAALISVCVGVFVFQYTSKIEFSETTFVYDPQRVIQPFELQDETNTVFTNDNLKGYWDLVFLGYLSCPDVCPMTLAKLSRILPELQKVSDKPVRIVFVSVDPKRDTPENMAKYIDYFGGNIKGVRAEHKNLFPFVRNLGLMYSIPDQEIEDGYFVDHSASIILVNPDAQIEAIFKPEIVLNQVPTVDTQTMLEDFKKLM
ncbi:SCO family protein [Psychrosphaera sp. 1_MG-2023]|uniref:SCO family protein n=1 Tax=Psychrosphaera sp. 1_MG-2023 TaxID=3062643 RepID=UPI0026E3B72A|nr:SCO family protein [Psychrosphaera sp. 1_MG-2023]MDO6719011.1 SCO family protein [Psychrosphaera sp. 1_MG-2023]